MIILLTAIRSCLLLLAFITLLLVGKERHVRQGTGWVFMTMGFGAVALGSLIQWGAYMPFLQGYQLFSNPEVNKIVAEICGFYVGICLVFIGMWKLGPILYKFYISEKKLVESERNFQTIVDTSIEGVVIIQDSKIIFANPSMEKMLGASPGELIGLRAMTSSSRPTMTGFICAGTPSSPERKKKASTNTRCWGKTTRFAQP